ncbi:MAG: fimbrial protein [Fusobacteria bacterium]|nr:MAG: fimbrial protein [Fusobacteriota bacterium]KAF0228543.1 MAG: fimbrial [Fusobacteriota bacterium]
MTIKTNKGFTLIEVIVTVAIIAMLAAVLIPSFSGLVEAADENRAILECQNTVKAAQTLYIDHFDNPNLVTKTSIKERAKLNGELVSYDQTLGTILHLQITLGKWTVTYCKNWETCSQHIKLYTTTKISTPAQTKPTT